MYFMRDIFKSKSEFSLTNHRRESSVLIIRQWSLKTKIVFLSWLFNKELTSSSQEGIVISSVIGFFVLICNVMLLIGIQYFGLFEVFKQELWAMVKWGMGDPAIQLSNLKNWSLTQWASGMAAPVAMYWSVILTARYLFYFKEALMELMYLRFSPKSLKEFKRRMDHYAILLEKTQLQRVTPSAKTSTKTDTKKRRSL